MWEFFTEGPVRLAPAVAEGRVTALTKEFRGIRAIDTMTLEVVKRSDLPPILSGLEVLAG